MRQRDAKLSAVLMALIALSGCTHKLNLRTTEVRNDVSPQNPLPRDTDNTPQRAALTEVALAEQYIETSQYEIALDRLQRATKLDPNSADAYTVLGLLYERINRPAQADASYAKSVKLAPDKGDVLNNYGAWLCRSGRTTEADAWFRKAVADPFYKTPAAALANASQCALKAGKPELAEGYDRQILAIDPANVAALQDMTSILFARGDFLHARAFVERLLAAGKIAPESLDLAASIEDKLGDTEAARGYRNRIATEFPQYNPPKR
jgi:type IV pilus assembly protein PilF